MATGWQNRLRTLLVLGRVSNLPTVWSNCLAAWLLGGGGATKDFLFIQLGASLLYLGGMFLNDAFDAEFDRQHRPERPIPSGLIMIEGASEIGAAARGVVDQLAVELVQALGDRPREPLAIGGRQTIGERTQQQLAHRQQ